MKKIQLLALAMAAALVPGMASATLIAALDFTGGGSAWTETILDAGYAPTLELDGDSSKYGFAANTTDTAAVKYHQEVFAPPGFTMSNIQVDAKVSGYSSWIMLGRFGFADGVATCTACNPYWTGSDHMSGIVTTDEPFSLDASGDPAFTGLASIVVMTEVHKGLAGVYQRPDVSDIRVYADLTAIPEPTSLALLALGAMAFARRRIK
jgi:hypothetical protein